MNIGSEYDCDNLDKFEKTPKHKLCSWKNSFKNRKEFVKGKWTARLREVEVVKKKYVSSVVDFRAQNNESPVQEEDENICWPMTDLVRD